LLCGCRWTANGSRICLSCRALAAAAAANNKTERKTNHTFQQQQQQANGANAIRRTNTIGEESLSCLSVCLSFFLLPSVFPPHSVVPPFIHSSVHPSPPCLLFAVMSDSHSASDPIPDMTRLALSSTLAHSEDTHDPRHARSHETQPRSERRLSSSSSSSPSLPSRSPPSSQARNPQLHAADTSFLPPLSSTPPPVPDRSRSSPASQERPNNPQELPESSVPVDVWADQGHYPLFLDNVSQRTIPVRGGTHLLFTGKNFRGTVVNVIYEAPPVRDRMVSSTLPGTDVSGVLIL